MKKPPLSVQAVIDMLEPKAGSRPNLSSVIDSRKPWITREAMKAVNRLIASHFQRFLKAALTGAKISSS